MKRLIKHLTSIYPTNDLATRAADMVAAHPEWLTNLPTLSQCLDFYWGSPLLGVEPTNLEALSPEELAEFENWADNLIL